MAFSRFFPGFYRKDLLNLGFILVIAVIHGLLYVFLVPPWQHYDEPNHFEYVRMVADRDETPEGGDYDQALNYALFSSLLEHDFFAWMDEPPVLGSPDDPVNIPGYSQFSEPPFYYWFASLPLRFDLSSSIEDQLYMARLTSFVLYLLTVFIAWGITCEITKAGSPLRWMAPFTLAMLPAFTDLMTSVNNDVSAIAVASIFLWGSVRLIRRGFSLIDLIWVLLSAGLSYFTKNIGFFTLLLLPVVLLFGVFRGSNRWIAWALIAGLAGILLAVLLVGGDAAYWYRATSQQSQLRQEIDPAIAGDYVLSIEPSAPVIPKWFPPVFQSVPVEVVTELRGETVSFGFWVWADQSMEIQLPVLDMGSEAISEVGIVDTQPKFFGYQASVPENATRIWIYLDPRLDQAPDGAVYYDGFILSTGNYPLDVAPGYVTGRGEQGEWGGQQFSNLLRNPSFETGAPRIRPVLDDFGAKILPNQARPSLLLMYFGDWNAMKYFHLLTFDRMYRSFWAQFGWGNVPLQYQQVYFLFYALGMLAMFGLIGGVIRLRRKVPWDVVFIFSLAILLSWGPTLSRSFGFMVQYKFYTPVARHVFPAVIPAVLFLTFGWLEVFGWLVYAWQWIFRKIKIIQVKFSFPEPIPMFMYIIPWIILDMLSIVSIMRFYATG